MTSISAVDFKNELSDLLILDIRTPSEIDEFNMGGIQILFDQLLEDISIIAHLKSSNLVIICYLGIQSKIACTILRKKGFTNIRSLEGGLEAYLSL